MKKIVITSHSSWAIFNFRRNLISSLIASGYRVYAIADDAKYSEELKLLGCEYINIPLKSRGKNPIYDFWTFMILIFTYRKIRPDVVCNYSPKMNLYSAIVASVFCIPFITNINGLGVIFNKSNWLSFLVKQMYKVSQIKAHKVFFQNDEDMDLFISENLISIDKAEKIPGSGVDLQRFKVVHANNDQVTRFLFLGRLLLEKGIIDYIEAARKIINSTEKVTFSILGPLLEGYKEVSQDRVDDWIKEGFVYLGFTDNVKEEIRKHDCIVLPSYYREGVPKSLMEAAAMGKPIITCDSIGCRELVDDGINGFLCRPKDPEDLKVKMMKIIKLTHQERIDMGLQGRKKVVSHFDENIVINKYLEEINLILVNN